MHQHPNFPPTNPSLFFFSPIYFKWPSFIPTYLPSHPSTPTHLPTSYTPHKREEILMKLYASIAIHVAPSNDKIQWKYCISSCKWLRSPSIFIPTSHPSRYLPNITQASYLLGHQYDRPPFAHQMKKTQVLHFFYICSHKPILMPRWR
jgi:hypothetical protein